MGLLMGKFRQILTRHAIFSFLDNNLSKYQGVLAKLGTCIDIKEVCFGIANGQILSIFDRVICPQHSNGRVLSFYVFIYVCLLLFFFSCFFFFFS